MCACSVVLVLVGAATGHASTTRLSPLFPYSVTLYRGWFLQMATSFFLVEFSTFGDLSFNVKPQGFYGVRGGAKSGQNSKKKKTFWCLSFNLGARWLPIAPDLKRPNPRF